MLEKNQNMLHFAWYTEYQFNVLKLLVFQNNFLQAQ